MNWRRPADPTAQAEDTAQQHTLGHIDCAACLRSEERFYNMHIHRISASMSFDEASEAFIAMKTAPPSLLGRARYVADGTLDCYGQYGRRLSIFFGKMKLESIGPWHLAEFQRMRLIGEGFTRTIGKGERARTVVSPAGPNKTNQEVGYLKRLLTLAGCWGGDLAAYYERFEQVDSDFMPALSWEEQGRYLEVAASRPEWQVVHWYSLVALHTCFSSDEMRTLLQGDINLTFGILRVNRRFGKNQYRRRDVSLTDGTCIWALGRLLERARDMGCAGPEKFLFPFREARGHFTGARQMSRTGLRGPFREIRALAGVPWFRFNGLRHTAITELAKVGVPIAIIQARAGHMSPKMTAHYTHISEAAQRIAMERAAGKRPSASVREMPRIAATA